MIKAIKNYFFPVVDEDVRALIDKNGTKSIEYISLVVAIFESIVLAYFIFTRESFGKAELTSISSVLFCIAACLLGYFVTRRLLKKDTPNHLAVAALNTIYYLLMSFWAIWSSLARYEMGEQIVTFYAVEIMLVCYIVMKPWLSAILTLGTYGLLYATLYKIDGAAGIHAINYSVLVLVSAIGMGVRYYSLLQTSEATIRLQKAKDSEIQDKLDILKAIADIYDKVNLIDFTDNTEMSVRDKDHVKNFIDLGNQTHTAMSMKMREHIMPDQLESFIRFTDITTVRTRLVGKRLISDDFINLKDGWFRAQYIPVEVDENGIPIRIVFTTRNVDDEKKREKRLVRIAMTDELTRIFNRRSYEEDLAECKAQGLDKDFVILSADVNGLKKVNDTMGHAGGDELIKGAAECIVQAVGDKGKAYRVGGDEFAAILHTADPQALCRDIEKYADNWHGEYSKEMSISVGYASHNENEELNIHELEKKADAEMYQSKARYYEKKGIDRRGKRS